MTSVSLCMIVKDAEETLEECLESSVPWMDEVVIVDTGSTDKTKEIAKAVCEKHGKPLILKDYEDPSPHPEHGWISNFSIPRNTGCELATKEVIFWLDADDVVLHAGEDGKPAPGSAPLREYIDEAFPQGCDAVSVLYDYGVDSKGREVIQQNRVRAYRRGYYVWTHPVHEVNRPTRVVSLDQDAKGKDFWVLHRSSWNRESSAERNAWIIHQWMDNSGDMDQRLWRGLASAYRVLGRPFDSLEPLERAVKVADNPVDRAACLVDLGNARADCEDHQGALSALHGAEDQAPNEKDAYFGMARACLIVKRYEDCLRHTERFFQATAENELANRPVAEEQIAAMRLQCFMETKCWDDARQTAIALYKNSPDKERWKPAIEECERGIREANLKDSWNMVSERMAPEARRFAASRIADPSLRAFPPFQHSLRPMADQGEGPLLNIWAGRTPNQWGPRSNETGTGGSEDAVIQLSKRMVERGWRVAVYGNPPAEDAGQDSHGVQWLHWSAWDIKDSPDVAVFWRYENAIHDAPTAGQRWLWLQDIPRGYAYTEDFVEQLDGVFVLSRYHRGRLGPHGEPKGVLTGNGIDPKSMADGENASHKFIYCSSPDRGLLPLLKAWPKFREAIPDAELHLFYGYRADLLSRFTDTILEHRHEIARMIWDLREQGVTNHGMVGEDELHAKMAECGFWLYPLCNNAETFCTTAAKVQACGAVPVTSKRIESSLPEVCGEWDIGEHFELSGDDSADEWADAVIPKILADETDRQVMKAWAVDKFDWDKVADQWNTQFRRGLAKSASETVLGLPVVETTPAVSGS